MQTLQCESATMCSVAPLVWKTNVRRHRISRTKLMSHDRTYTRIDQCWTGTVSGEHTMFASAMIYLGMSHTSLHGQLVSDLGTSSCCSGFSLLHILSVRSAFDL